MEEISFGNVKSPKDKRDFKIGKVQSPVAIPEVFMPDYSNLPTYHQSKQPACTAHAAVWMVNYLDFHDVGMLGKLVPRMIYALSKRDDGIPNEEGTYYRQALKELKDYGVCSDPYFANDVSLSKEEYKDWTKIPQSAYEEGEPRKIASYVALDTITMNSLKQAIYQNKIVLLGMYVGESFWTDKYGNVSWKASDLFPLRSPEPIVSGHAVVAIGYDKDNIYFKNSFGPTWGNNGVGHFNSSYLPYVYEAWTVMDLPDEVIKQLKQAQLSLIEKLKLLISKLLSGNK